MPSRRRSGSRQGLALGAALLSSVVAWKLACSTYRADIRAICDGEREAGLLVRRDMAAVTERIRARLVTPEGNRFFSSLRDLPIGARADCLFAESRAIGVPSCPMIDAYRQLAVEAEYRTDVQRLCSYVTFPGLGEVDDGVRIRTLGEWIREFATTDRTRQLGATLGRATTSGEASRALRDAAAEIDVFTCDTAKVLDRLPLSSGPAGPVGP